MAIRKTGDWAKVQLLIGALSKEMDASRQIALKQIGLKMEGTAKKHIRDQDLGWTPLTADYARAKERAGLSDKTLVATSDYFQAITSYVSQKKVALAGVRKGKTNSEGKVIANIAAVLEFGSAAVGIPARKLWKPTLEETVDWVVKEKLPVKIFEERIEKYFR